MLADPQSITISTVTSSLARTGSDKDESEYRSADGLYLLTLSHSYGKRKRHVVRFDHSKVAPDVHKPAENVSLGMSVYTVFDMPGRGEYSNTEAGAIFTGFNTMINAASAVMITKLLAGES